LFFACVFAWPLRQPAGVTERLVFFGILVTMAAIAIVVLYSHVKLYQRTEKAKQKLWLFVELDDKVFPLLHEAIRGNERTPLGKWKQDYIHLHGGVEALLDFFLERRTLPGVADERTPKDARHEIENRLQELGRRYR